MGRISRNDLNMFNAELESHRSTCLRKHVGAVLLRDHRVIITGYNGAASGEPHCGDECKHAPVECPNSVHAEANIIAFAAKFGIATDGTVLYSTTAPCLHCARLIVNAGIRVVVWKDPYKNDLGLELLRRRIFSVERWEADAAWDIQCLD